MKDKYKWNYTTDVMYFDQWPIAQASLYFGGIHGNKTAMKLWEVLDHFPKIDEVIRNFPIRNPILWISKNNHQTK